MLQDIERYLACPHCAQALTRHERALRCPAGHSFDLAKQGYVSLLAGDAHTGTGDTAEMVAARADFLAAGHYRPIADALAEAAADADPEGLVADLGAGTGHYLAHVLDALPGRAGPPSTSPSSRCAAPPRLTPGSVPWSATPGGRCRCATPPPG